MKDEVARFNMLMGRWIREQREAGRMTQQKLADSVGISRSSLGMMERGHTGISAVDLASIADVLGADVNQVTDFLAIARSSHLSGALSDPGPDYRLGRISAVHVKNVDSRTGMTDGFCRECSHQWPCPTAQWATMKVDAMCSDDLRECAFDEDMPDYLKHNHQDELEAM